MRTRAYPLSLEIVQAMAVVAYTRNRPQFAQALLMGFAGLMRVSEIDIAKLGEFNFLRDDCAILTLSDSKGVSRSGQSETVIFKDVALLRQLKGRFQREGGEANVCSATYNSSTAEYKDVARFLGLRQECVTPHGLRRGGAT